MTKVQNPPPGYKPIYCSVCGNLLGYALTAVKHGDVIRAADWINLDNSPGKHLQSIECPNGRNPDHINKAKMTDVRPIFA